MLACSTGLPHAIELQGITWENMTLSDWHPRGFTGVRSTTFMTPLVEAPAIG